MPTIPNSENAPKVSIIMLTMNRAQHLPNTIRSAQQQTMADWELIVVHDGPDRHTVQVMEPLVAADPRIRYFHREQIGNIADGMNYGLSRSRGSFIAVLDDDDAWIQPRKLELQVTFLEAHPGICCVGGGAVVVNGSGEEQMRYLKPCEPAACRAHALVANPLIHSSVLYRKSIAEQVGGYDVGLRGYQDWDLWLKFMRVSQVANIADYLATYRVWDGGGSSSNVMANAWSGFRIVNRHGRHFPKYGVALLAAIAYTLFAILPNKVRRGSYQSLSKLKKRLFTG